MSRTKWPRIGRALALGLILLALATALWFMGFRLRRAPAVESGQRVELAAKGGAERLPASPTVGTARNVVLLIGDGLGFSQVAAARAELAGAGGRLFFERLPFTGWVSTHSVSGLITDSAAGATAMATGWKTLNGRLAVDAEGRPLRTLLEAARDRGMATGLVTSSYFMDATPAAFAAHAISRRDYAEVAIGIAESGVDLVLGEQRRGLTPDDGGEGQRLFESYRAEGYRLAYRWSDLPAEGDGRLLGAFPVGAVTDLETAPNLPDLAGYALTRLASREEGFFLMIEDEESDSGAHRGDYDRVRQAIRHLEAVTEAAVDFARRDGQTLVILTSDHETGGFQILSGIEDEPLGYRFTTRHHTGSPVPLYAYGPGGERFRGVLDNTDIARLIAESLGLRL